MGGKVLIKKWEVLKETQEIRSFYPLLLKFKRIWFVICEQHSAPLRTGHSPFFPVINDAFFLLSFRKKIVGKETPRLSRMGRWILLVYALVNITSLTLLFRLMIHSVLRTAGCRNTNGIVHQLCFTQGKKKTYTIFFAFKRSSFMLPHISCILSTTEMFMSASRSRCNLFFQV